MSVCTDLATLLDMQMIQTRPGYKIYDENTPESAMPVRTGRDVEDELGGRLLLRYLRLGEVSRPAYGTDPTLKDHPIRAWASPTAYGPTEAVRALALPAATEPRTHVVLLKAAGITKIQGPRRVWGGLGIEYLLPEGYPASALAHPWERLVQ